MRIIKRATLIAIFVLAFVVGQHSRVRAQSTTTLQIQAAAAHTACTVSAAGGATYCFATDGLWQSINGAAYVQLGATAPTGVTSITVCNAAGSSCGAAQTGAVSLDVPKAATTTVTSTASTTFQ